MVSLAWQKDHILMMFCTYLACILLKEDAVKEGKQTKFAVSAIMLSCLKTFQRAQILNHVSIARFQTDTCDTHHDCRLCTYILLVHVCDGLTGLG